MFSCSLDLESKYWLIDRCWTGLLDTLGRLNRIYNLEPRQIFWAPGTRA